MDTINFNTTNMIILVYPEFAGGKFVSNCLSLSHHAVPQHHNNQSANTTLALLDMNKTSDEYRFRRYLINNSLPPIGNTNVWRRYEYGCFEFYGMQTSSMAVSRDMDFHAHVAPVSNSNKKFFIVAHNPDTLQEVRNAWPNASVLSLSNYEHHQQKSISLKQRRTREIPIYNITPNDYEHCSHTHVDMSKLYDFSAWSAEIQRLYIHYGFDDFNQEYVREFWEKYMALHR